MDKKGTKMTESKPLLDVLNTFKKFVSKNSFTSSNEKSFHFADGYLEACNGLIYGKTKLDLGIKGCINPDVLCKVVKSFADEALKFDDKEDCILVSNGNSEIKINKEQGEYPELEYPDEEWNDFPDNSWEKIKTCSKTMIYGVVVSDKTMGSNGVGLTIIDNDKDLFDTPIIIDSEFLEILSTIEGRPVKFLVSDNNDLFLKWDDDSIFVGKCLDKESTYYNKLITLYNDSDGFIDKIIEDGIEFKLDENWKSTLNRCSIFSDLGVTIHKTRKKVVLSTNNNLGNVEEDLSYIGDDKPCNFMVNLKYLKDLLDFSNTIMYSPTENRLLAKSDGFTRILVCLSKD